MKYVYITIGTITLILGIIGIALPIMPTVPFLLCTLICYMKGSKKMHQWFTNTILYKKYLVKYEKGMTIMQKWLSFLIVFASLFISTFLLQFHLYALIGSILILILYCIYLIKMIPTIQD